MNRFRRSIGPGGERPAKPTNPPPAKISAPSTPPCATPTLKVEVGMSDLEWAATVDRVTRERDDEHLARVEAEAKVERLNAAWNECSADKHRLLKEARALDAEVERLREELADVTKEADDG